MSNVTPAIAALTLVPITIAASAAYLALKTTEFYKCISRSCSRVWQGWSLNPLEGQQDRRRHKLRRSNLSSSQTYADSWFDLESNPGDDPGYSTFINQSPIHSHQTGLDSHNTSLVESTNRNDTPKRIWHPARSARLTWSFANPRSLSPNRFESSSVLRPLPVAQLPGKLGAEAAELLVARMTAEGVRH